MEHYIEKLLKYVNYPNGVFIECGANDGITQSYTYELEKLGWRGLLIEPSIVAFNSCRKNRSEENKFYNCALVANESITAIKGDFDGHPMSSVWGKRLNRDGQIIVPTRTLNSILEELEITDIDLFSLDVEGYEAEVLKGFDIMKYKPKFIIVEVNTPVEAEVNALLKDYKVIANLTGYNKRENPQWDGTHNDFLYGI
jgi:FkbM family methyltransferase